MTGMHKRRGNIVVREVDDGVLLLDMAANRIHQLNQTAGYVWSRCEAESVQQMAESLAEEFDVSADVATRDVLEVLGTLRELSLVVEVRS